mgnify:CR=1 FL=1
MMERMTRIPDLLAAGRTLSFEFSAPRDAEGQERLARTLDRLSALRPAFMSVTGVDSQTVWNLDTAGNATVAATSANGLFTPLGASHDAYGNLLAQSGAYAGDNEACVD